MKNKIKLAGLYLLAGLAYASGPDPAEIIATTICNLVPDVLDLARVLALLMFIYGGAKYAFSADDPGGRKQGKNIAVNAIIGLLIVAISYTLVANISGINDFCT